MALAAVVRFGDLSQDRSALDALYKGKLIENTVPEGIVLRLGLQTDVVEQQLLTAQSPKYARDATAIQAS